ncbi:hypothetical protein [Pseudobacteriovorax antillogorgiicola]|uniref:Uncharacterized protein n=1 Tax=Pseudobacteriovorax antillogorgiicola TaxID=1513793 RepID=A0A1Y6B3Z1_9BACT|nr:hypothetical protein [Pseudobacteriovorax antillogorgiicola]TCS59213.1 hypothetical protein EDD56_101116 [Pseudobacteriovorax antillogorgiicola]SME90496.1 hypothetical protein SAMN06296036_101370 [Pseudobacteriovorax antillogorgiicola]
MRICLLLAGLWGFEGYGQEACYGSKSAKTGMIYFHGIDNPSPDAMERENRRHLEKVALKENLRIFVPRGTLECRPGKVCWAHYTINRARQVFQRVKAQSQNCLGQATLKIAMGFSNGGYLVNRLFVSCAFNKEQVVIVAGARGHSSSVPDQAKECGSLMIHIGKRDQMYARAQRYHEDLKKRNFPVFFSPFDGAHELRYKPLKELISQAKSL